MYQILKRVFLLAITTVPAALTAQTDRKVVIEHFTNTNCPICGSRNPGLFTNLDNNGEGVIHVSYYPSSPYSDCKLNNHNKKENDDRTKYYGLYGGTPQIAIQGESKRGASFTNSSLFDAYKDQMSSFELEVAQIKTEEKIEVSIVITAAEDNSVGNMNLVALMVEDTVFYKGRNSEREHFNVFRKSLAGIEGESQMLPSSKGESIAIEYSTSNHNDWDVNRMYAVVFLQDPMSKEVHQAATSPNKPLPTSIPLIEDHKVSIYPTSVNNQITVSGFETGASYSITNLQGQSVLKGVLVDPIISVPAIKSGIYMLRIDQKVFKIVKE